MQEVKPNFNLSDYFTDLEVNENIKNVQCIYYN